MCIKVAEGCQGQKLEDYSVLGKTSACHGERRGLQRGFIEDSCRLTTSISVHDDHSTRRVSYSSCSKYREWRIELVGPAHRLSGPDQTLARSCIIRQQSSRFTRTYRHSKRFKVQRSNPNLLTLDDLRPNLDATILLYGRGLRGDYVSSRMMPSKSHKQRRDARPSPAAACLSCEHG